MAIKKGDKFEFIIITKDLLLNDKLSYQAKILLAYLRFRQYKHETAFPGYRRIEKDTGISMTRLKILIEQCVNKKLLTVWWGKGQNGANIYAVHLSREDEKIWNRWTKRGVDEDKGVQSSQEHNLSGVMETITPETSEPNTQSNQEVTPSGANETITPIELSVMETITKKSNGKEGKKAGEAGRPDGRDVLPAALSSSAATAEQPKTLVDKTETPVPKDSTKPRRSPEEEKPRTAKIKEITARMREKSKQKTDQLEEEFDWPDEPPDPYGGNEPPPTGYYSRRK